MFFFIPTNFISLFSFYQYHIIEKSFNTFRQKKNKSHFKTIFAIQQKDKAKMIYKTQISVASKNIINTKKITGSH